MLNGAPLEGNETIPEDGEERLPLSGEKRRRDEGDDKSVEERELARGSADGEAHPHCDATVYNSGTLYNKGIVNQTGLIQGIANGAIIFGDFINVSTEGSMDLDLLSRDDQNGPLLNLKANLKNLTSRENQKRKKVGKLGSNPGRNCKSEVGKCLENVEQRRNRIEGEVNGLAEQVWKDVGGEELAPCSSTLIKRCFLYSAFYAVNRRIKRGELILNFVDEGVIIGKESSLEEQFDEGHKILDQLEVIGLLEGGNSDPSEEYKLGGENDSEEHSLAGENDSDDKWLKSGTIVPESKWVEMVGDVSAKAISIIKESSGFLVAAGLNLKEIPSERNWADVHTVSLMDNSIQEISQGTSLECPQLSTLIFKHNPLEEIPRHFFSNMPALQVIDLSYTKIKYLPYSISELKFLSSLLMTSCCELQSVPPLGGLENLTRLDLSGTRITRVPGLEKLIKLSWLNLFGTELLVVNTRFLIPLTNLQFLVLALSSRRMGVTAQNLIGLKRLKTFGGNLYSPDNFNTYVRAMERVDYRPRNYLLHLGSTAPPMFTFSKVVIFSQCKNIDGQLCLVLPADVEQLYLEFCEQWRCMCDVISSSKATCLKYCKIFECDELEKLFCFSDSCSFCSSLQNLESMELCVLDSLRSLWREKEATISAMPSLSGALSRLRFLKISDCGMETLFTPGLLAHLQSLEKVYVEYCLSLKEIFSITDMEEMDKELSGANQSNNNSYNSAHTTFQLPMLVSFVLRRLPELTSVCRGKMACNHLQEFIIEGCHSLEKLPENEPRIRIQVIP